LTESDELKNILFSKAIERGQHAAIVNKISEKLNFPKALEGFLQKLAQNRRLYLLPNILTLFNAFVDSQEQIRHVEVVSASELTAVQKKKLNHVFSQSIPGTLQINYSLDSTLLGGIVVRLSIFHHVRFQDHMRVFEVGQFGVFESVLENRPEVMLVTLAFDYGDLGATTSAPGQLFCR
jgi:ATP synthase F1 delta subunit